MTVTIYRSTDGSAPVLTGLGGSMIDLLDAILVNGYGAKASQGWTKSFTTSVAWGGVIGSGNVFSGTATGGANNKLIDTATNFVTCVTNGIQAGMSVIRTADGKRGLVTSISTTTNPNDTLNYTAYGTATPTFGASDAYTIDSNRRAYRQPVGTTNGFYLRILDSNPAGASSTYGRMRGFETMSDVDTGTGPFPTDAQVVTDGGAGTDGLYFTKSSAVDGTSRPWFAIGNGKIFYLVVDGANNSVNSYAYVFGDYISYKPGDAYGTMIVGHISAGSNGSYTGNYFYLTSLFSAGVLAHYGPRSYTQTGGSVKLGKFRDINRGQNYSGNIGYGSAVYPHKASGGLMMGIVEIHEPNRDRGKLPGLWDQFHPANSYFTPGDTFSGVGVMAGKTFEIRQINTAYALVFETSDTW